MLTLSITEIKFPINKQIYPEKNLRFLRKSCKHLDILFFAVVELNNLVHIENFIKSSNLLVNNMHRSELTFWIYYS